MPNDDDATAETLGLIEAFADHNQDMAATAIGQMNTKELRQTISRLLMFHAVRGKLGTKHTDTAQWARWLRNTHPNLTL